MLSHSKFGRGTFAAASFFAALPLTLAATATRVTAQPPAHATISSAYPVQTVGKYAVTLRLPANGLFAGEETDVELHIADTSQDDPVQGAPPIVRAQIRAIVTMPAMSMMPAQSPKIHSEGVPGDYGIVLFFPHGGDFKIDLTITPPGDKPFIASFTVPVNDAEAAKNRTAKPKPYTLEVVSDPASPKVGEPANLSILIRSRETGKPVTEFDTVHERQIHFMVVSRDLSFFAHEHPTLGADGTFTMRYTFPTGGEYRLFADVAPHQAGSQILMQPLRVSGKPAAAQPISLSPSLIATVDGIRTTLANDPAKFPVGRGLNLSFTQKDSATNTLVTDNEPYLGAMAHLMLIHEDGMTFVHSHPDETNPLNGRNGTITFLARFPKPGFYRGWLQYQRAGKVETAAFTWRVAGSNSTKEAAK